MHDFRTQFNDQEWEAILNHSLQNALSIDTTVHRFIFAAPALLEALQDMCSCEYGTDAALAATRKARAAIKAATGR